MTSQKHHARWLVSDLEKHINLCQKLLRLSQLNKGLDGGILAPDFPSFKKDIKPTFEAIFDATK
jgi:hypothetical protein